MLAPDLSIIIPSVNSYDDLHGCLKAIDAQTSAVAEVIVVDRLGDALRGAVQRDFPSTIILPVASDTTIPEMRAVGIAAATAPAVAVIEDHVIVPPDWARRMLDALA